VRHLPVDELADLLDGGFDALDRAGPDHRHRTLETAFDWTWDLLDDGERRVLARLAALPRSFDLALAEAVTKPGAASVVLRLLDRSLVSPTVGRSHPRRFRLLVALRAFVLDRADPTDTAEVRRLHAHHYVDLMRSLAAKARTDDSVATAEKAHAVAPEASAAISWAVETRDPVAVPLARSLAIVIENYGADLASVDAVSRAARDLGVRQLATADDLLDIGLGLGFGDLDLVDELAQLALAKAEDDRSRLSAHHLAGYAAGYRGDGHSAMRHYEIAATLADERIDAWQLASVEQGRGMALRTSPLNDPRAAIAAFEAAMRAYALAGDAMHVSNSRYMMAMVAAEWGERSDEAVGWADQCIEYARGSGNPHELAHAIRVRAQLTSDLRDMDEALAIFRAVGDLRCVGRSYLLLAGGRPPVEQLPYLRQALDVTRRAHDDNARAGVPERLVAAQWNAGRRREAAVALGSLIAIIGRDEAIARAPDALQRAVDAWEPAIAEGQARSGA
jgi:tetratricopeptide (TPR) repeat protein